MKELDGTMVPAPLDFSPDMLYTLSDEVSGRMLVFPNAIPLQTAAPRRRLFLIKQIP